MAKAGPERTRGSNSCCGSLLRVLSAPPEPPPASIRLKGSCCGLRAREAAPGMLPLGRRQKVPFDPSRPWHRVTNPPLPLPSGHERNRTIATQKVHKLPAAPWVLQSCACTRFLLPFKPPFPGSCSIPASPLLPEKLPGLNPLHSEVSLTIICFLANAHVHFHDICSNFWEPFLACFLSTKGAEKSSSSSSIPPMKTN